MKNKLTNLIDKILDKLNSITLDDIVSFGICFIVLCVIAVFGCGALCICKVILFCFW